LILEQRDNTSLSAKGQLQIRIKQKRDNCEFSTAARQTNHRSKRNQPNQTRTEYTINASHPKPKQWIAFFGGFKMHGQ
jgi:hypothetical protein